MARDIIDDRLLGALHLQVMDRAGFAHDPTAEHIAFQAGTLNALMAGQFDGDATVGEILQHGDLGIGTIQGLNGEMVVVDGRAFVIGADGEVRAVNDDTRTPFAVVCRFVPRVDVDLDQHRTLAELTGFVDGLIDGPLSVLAVRVDGQFRDLRLRSVHGQTKPYPPLTEVTGHQIEWLVPEAHGSLVGFRFGDRVAGIEVPGYHLHFLSDDHRYGGHVLDLTVLAGRVLVDGGDDLHVELPADVQLGTPGLADRAAIRQAEGG